MEPGSVEGQCRPTNCAKRWRTDSSVSSAAALAVSSRVRAVSEILKLPVRTSRRSLAPSRTPNASEVFASLTRSQNAFEGRLGFRRQSAPYSIARFLLERSAELRHPTSRLCVARYGGSKRQVQCEASASEWSRSRVRYSDEQAFYGDRRSLPRADGKTHPPIAGASFEMSIGLRPRRTTACSAGEGAGRRATRACAIVAGIGLDHAFYTR